MSLAGFRVRFAPMPWLEVSVDITAGQQALVERSLEHAGALSVTLLDADADTPNEHAILEPGVGETPLWGALRVSALFDVTLDRDALLRDLLAHLPAFTPDRFHFAEIADQDWTRVWLDDFKPMRFGRRLWIYPSTIEPPGNIADAVIVRLDPGLAFGTGTHPTTALCLAWLDAQDLVGRTVIDYGCGSGVLAIAALKLGAARVIGVDNDAQAITASRENAERNGITADLELVAPQAFQATAADALVANILAGPLGELAPRFADCVKPGGAIALSGILDGQRHDLLARYADAFDALVVTHQGDWLRIDGVRRG